MTIRIGILTVSDRSSRGERVDDSGPVLADVVQGQGWTVVKAAVVADEESAIRATLTDWADQGLMDVILTTGGTGFAPRDVTPEATQAVIEREAAGLEEAMRAESLRKTPHGMLSRGVAGIRARTIIINLPGSPTGALENLRTVLEVLPHAVELVRGDPSSQKLH